MCSGLFCLPNDKKITVSQIPSFNSQPPCTARQRISFYYEKSPFLSLSSSFVNSFLSFPFALEESKPAFPLLLLHLQMRKSALKY